MSDESELGVVVAARREIAHDVIELELRAVTGMLPAWQPGAHIDLVLSPDLVRQYSLCGDPGDQQAWRIAVLRESAGRGGSVHVHDQVEQGQELRARGPRNHFELAESPTYLFIAGGIGITPILTMVEQAERAGADWRLLYGGRTASSMAYLDRLRVLRSERISICPEDEFGLLDLKTFLGQPRSNVLVYCCGPEGLLSAVERRSAAWPAGTLHLERFAARDLDDPLRSGSFAVELERTGTRCVVRPDQSILDAVREAGVEVPTSCEEGTCGTCETRLIAGLAEHRDSILSPAEQAANDTIYICVSRALSDVLVLDL